MAGEIIDRNLRQRNLPFYLYIDGISGNDFTFCGDIEEKNLGILPNDHLRHQKDLGSLLQVGIPVEETTLDTVIANLPKIQIREYTQDTRIDYVLSIAKMFVKGMNDGQQVASGQFDFGQIREAFGLMIHDVKTLESQFWTNVGNAFTSKPVFGNYGNEKDKKALIDFVYALYYEMVSTTTTNRYTLPFNLQENILKGNGFDGWDSFSMNGSFMEHMGALTGFLGKGLSIYTTPVWQGIKNSEGYGFDMTLNLFNDTIDHALVNYIFINTIIPQNLPTHYAVFQQAPSVYDIKIQGFQRLFMCSGDFSCSMKGCLRKPSETFITELLKFANKKYNFNKDSQYIRDIRIPDVYEVHFNFKSLLPNTFNNFIFQYLNVEDDMMNMEFQDAKSRERSGWGEDYSITKAIGEWGKQRWNDGKDLAQMTKDIKEDNKAQERWIQGDQVLVYKSNRGTAYDTVEKMREDFYKK